MGSFGRRGRIPRRPILALLVLRHSLREHVLPERLAPWDHDGGPERLEDSEVPKICVLQKNAPCDREIIVFRLVIAQYGKQFSSKALKIEVNYDGLAVRFFEEQR